MRSGLPPNVSRTAVTMGTFDGVHRGHQYLIAQLVQVARKHSLASVLLTFDPHPLEIVNPSAAPLLLTPGAEKLEVLAESEVDYVAVVPFTSALSRLTAREFVEEILVDRFRVGCLLMGPDHGFGRDRAGGVEMVRGIGAERGFDVELISPVTIGEGRAISSTAIRRAIAGGDLERAAEGLGRPYSLSGMVVRGMGRGRGIGYPTINVQMLSARKLLPPLGVYAARVQTPAGAYGAMLNLGPRPTFGDGTVTLEAHLFDFSGDLYDAPVRLDLISRLRDTRKFDSVEDLAAQLAVDARSARGRLSLSPV